MKHGISIDLYQMLLVNAAFSTHSLLFRIQSLPVGGRLFP